ncbi:glycoside hydrolase family 92 protein [Pedobacter petrophilus]|uniref:Glycoside hydrolase family 92 protein n=1 Tax=Pedobacter petrophilus TaxID=1908241 RepID=A0A7K0G0D6_9SPHI|nr:GH92 family glycosyl hydrolase [Pedobacter petrophilus]MRX77317.1 glycoside hydrolase family 92 protein [Pedobacter petrophilus]
MPISVSSNQHKNNFKWEIILLLLVLQLIALPNPGFGQQASLVKYIQPFSGTSASTTMASQHIEDKTERLANTIPAVAPPFAMTQWTPQTQLSETKCLAPYYYSNKKIYGFRATHWISGSCTQDYGSFTIMPISGKLKTKWIDIADNYSHAQEVSSPDYYKVTLPNHQLITEITATLRSSMMRITALKSDSVYLLISPNSDQNKGFIKIDQEKGEISGYNPVHRIYQGWGQAAGFSGYFYIRIQKSFHVSGSYAAGKTTNQPSVANKKDIGVFAGFKLQKGAQLIITSGTSFTSIAAAKLNLEKEIGAASFNATRAKTKAAWEESLAQVKIADNDERRKTIFYTAMYHAQQHPRLFNDIDGSYPQFAGDYQIKKITKGNYYDDFSMWDIYRAQLPLVELLQPKLANSFANSLIIKGTQGGWLPIFPCWNSYTAAMIGDHSTAFLAAAYNKGIRDYDVNEAYRLMRQNAFEMPDSADYLNGKGRRGINSYLKYGYIPMEDSIPNAFHKKEQVSRTLEYAYDDYALSTIAKDLGKVNDYKELHKRSLNYKNVFDPKVGMVRGKYINGEWYSPYLPDHREAYITEGTPRQYTFYVPHDMPGLISIMGGKKALENELDSIFTKKEYWHGNEPGHQIPFLYNYTSAPWKTQKQVSKILAEEYGEGAGGLSGNDDAGQMSAWYVFAALGLYPVDPVSGVYQVTSPLFNQATISFKTGKNLTIKTIRTTKNSIYISKMLFNGKILRQNQITHQDLINGGNMTFYLQEKPGSK